MGDPTPDQVAVAVQAMRTDAATWHAAAGTLTAAQHAGQPLDLHEFQFSFVDDKAGLTHVYAQLKDKITRLLGEGATELDALAQALTTAANRYEQSDNAAYRRSHHIY
jgi:hypothetical protein